MATFSLHERHQREASEAAKRQRNLTVETRATPAQTAGGDPRYRIPAIGLNTGHIPGTRPDQAHDWMRSELSATNPCIRPAFP